MARKAPPAVRHVLAHRTVTLIAALTALLTAALAAAAVSFLGQVTAGAAGRELSGKASSVVAVTAQVSRSDLSLVTRDIAGDVRRLLPGLRPRVEVSVQSDTLDLPGRAVAPASGGRLQTQLVTLPAFASHMTAVSGTCAVTARGAGELPACVPQSVARELGARAGTVLVLRDSIGGQRIRVRVTGVFRPASPRSSYWQLDPLGAGSTQRAGGFATAGPLVTSPAAMASAAVAASSITVIGTPDLRLLPGSDVGTFGSRLAARIASLNNAGPHGAAAASGLPAQLSAIAAALEVARTRILGSILTLLVAGAVTLAIAARLLTRRRAVETAMLGARGASRAQIARRGLTDAAVVAVPAVLAGPAVGAALLTWLGLRPGAFSGGGLTAGSWLAAAVVAAAGLAVIVVPWLRRPQSPLRQRSSRGRAVVAAVYSRADLVVIALAAGAVWQLLRSRGPVAQNVSGTLSADPILVLAPVLALAGAALLTLRLLPLAARLSDRLAARSRGVIGAAAAWQLSRRALREAGPTLITVLAVAAAVMAISGRSSWQRSVHAQASFQVGADARLTLPVSLQAGQVAAITAARGVTASTPAVRQGFSLPGQASGTLLAVNTEAAAGIIPRAAAGPAPATLRRLAVGGQIGVAVPGHPAALRFTVRTARSSLGPLAVTASVSDAAGVSYALPAGSVRTDGRPHVLKVSVGGRHADYPLRLTGFTLSFNVPGRKRPAQRVRFAAAAALPGGSGRPVAFAVAAAGSRVRASATQGTGGTDPLVLAARAKAGSLTISFSPGVLGKVVALQGVATGVAQVSLTDGVSKAVRALPAVVTRSLLASTGSHLGGRLQLTTGNTTIDVMAVAAVRFLPTAGSAPAVLVDQRSLADVLAATGAPPEPVTEWWLRTSGHLALRGLPAGTSVLTRQRLTDGLLADPLAAAAQRAQLAIAAAAILLALLALLIGVLTADRSRDLALLDALGMRPRQVARMLAFEQILSGVATAAVGLLVGYLLTRLIVPADTLTAQAARPVPPLAVHVPWLVAGCVAAVIATVPTLAILLAPPRTDKGAAMLRNEAPT